MTKNLAQKKFNDILFGVILLLTSDQVLFLFRLINHSRAKRKTQNETYNFSTADFFCFFMSLITGFSGVLPRRPGAKYFAVPDQNLIQTLYRCHTTAVPLRTAHDRSWRLTSSLGEMMNFNHSLNQTKTITSALKVGP